MSLIQRFGIIASALLLAASSAWSQEPTRAKSGTVGLSSLEQLALQRNPTLVQAGAQVQISNGKALQAGLYPNPTVGYVADQIGVGGTAGEFHGAFVEQEIYTAGKLRLSRQKYNQEALQAQYQIAAQQYRVLYSVRVAYYELLVRQKRLELQRALVGNTEEVVKSVAELVNVGQANRPDLLQAQIRLQRAKASLIAAEKRAEGSREELAAVVGAPELALSTFDGKVELDETAEYDRQTTLNDLLGNSPQLQFAQAEVLRDQVGLEREQVEPIPNVLLRGEVGRNFESRDTVGGLEIGLKLPIFDRNQGTICQAQAELTRAQAEVSRVELELRRRFAETFAEYEAALASVKSFQKESLPQAEEVYRLYLESFQQRQAAWPQVLDAQREYLELNDEYLDNVLQARRAEARISSLFLDEGLSQPPSPEPEGHREATPRPR